MDKSKRRKKRGTPRSKVEVSPPVDSFTHGIPALPEHDQLRGQLLELYARVINSTMPTDQLLGGFLRRRKNIVGGARGFLAATLYALLRRRVRTLLLWGIANKSTEEELRRIGWTALPALAPEEEARLALTRWLAEDLGAPRDVAESLTAKAVESALAFTGPADEAPLPWSTDAALVRQLTDAQPHVHDDVLRLALETSIPPALIERWQQRFGEETPALCRAMTSVAPLDIRVSRRVGREAVKQTLETAAVPTQLLRFSSDGLRLGKKLNLAHVEGIEPGTVEVQDEGSQLVSLALGADPGSRLLDACAGAGGKTLHLADLVGDRGEVFAHDSETPRLEILRKRCETAGCANVRILQPGDAADHAPYDAVLIDAPCLGLGRLRREPTLAWRGPLAARLAEVTALQRECLEQYAPLVRAGGVLVYATCSIEAEETVGMMEWFLSAHPGWSPDPLPAIFQREELAAFRAPKGSHVTLLPSLHGTDGFFMARIRKNE